VGRETVDDEQSGTTLSKHLAEGLVALRLERGGSQALRQPRARAARPRKRSARWVHAEKPNETTQINLFRWDPNEAKPITVDFDLNSAVIYAGRQRHLQARDSTTFKYDGTPNS